jgi:hypothetical protein
MTVERTRERYRKLLAEHPAGRVRAGTPGLADFSAFAAQKRAPHPSDLGFSGGQARRADCKIRGA